MRKAFTIVELLIVIAVIGILGGIITNAAIGSIKNAREKRKDMMCTALEQGIAAYYAQLGSWPDPIEKIADKGEGDDDADTHMFDADETDEIFQEVVGAGFGKSKKLGRTILVDATALFVAKKDELGNDKKGCYDNHGNPKKRETYCAGRGCINGVDFSIATAKSGKYHIQFKDMAFGYQGPETGKFCRYWVVYNRKTDTVTVTTKGPDL